MSLGAAAQGAGAAAKPAGAVYTQTNDPSGNEVIAFKRKPNGQLRRSQTISTGGNGSTQSVGCGPNCPILDSQNAVVVSKNGKYVAAVNAGSNTVSSFLVRGNRLRLADQKSSAGEMPESLAIYGNVLYVLNVDTDNGTTTGNVSGFTISKTGKLRPIAGSTRPLAHAAPPDATARAMEFSPNGKVLVVTELAANAGAGAIDTFVMGPGGVAGPVQSYPSSDGFPFGFAFDPSGRLVVSNLRNPTAPVDGSVSTYDVSDAGVVTAIDTESSRGVLPCWVAVSKDGKFTYVVNTGAGPPATVGILGLNGAAELSFLGLSEWFTNEFARTDVGLSRDGRYVYVLAPSVGNPNAAPSHINVYKRRGDGSLSLIAKTGGDLGPGASGLATR